MVGGNIDKESARFRQLELDRLQKAGLILDMFQHIEQQTVSFYRNSAGSRKAALRICGQPEKVGVAVELECVHWFAGDSRLASIV